MQKNAIAEYPMIDASNAAATVPEVLNIGCHIDTMINT